MSGIQCGIQYFTPGTLLGLRVLQHFWLKIVRFFWSKYLNQFSINIIHKDLI